MPSKVKWRRVPGSAACKWCRLIAGPPGNPKLYKSSASADFGHSRCDCVAVPVQPGETFAPSSSKAQPKTVIEGDWSPHARAELEAAAAKLTADYDVPLRRIVMDHERLSAGKSNDTIYLPAAWNNDAFMAKRAKEWKFITIDQGRAATVTHEYGHILDGALQRRRPDLYEKFNDFLEEPVELHGRMVPRIQHGLEAPSPYGTENRYEFAAEAFADWRKNGTNAHPSSQFVGKLFDEGLGKETA